MMIVFVTVLTYVLYRLAKWLGNKYPILLFHPLIFTPGLIILVVYLSGMSFQEYQEGSVFLTHLLGPATISFAIPVYKHRAFLKKYFLLIVTSVLIGSVVAILSTLGFALLFGLEDMMVISLLPRSITTPLAIEVANEIGGVPALAIVFVIITGILGALMAPSIFKWLNIKSQMAKGLALGMSAHAVGTNRAFEYGEEAVTFSTLAMIFAGVITILLSLTVLPFIVAVI
ncbi:TIGR00659 family protein [Pelagirhabdus alkalitolerans]|uniref:TIGR00659 family protein n=1 Tax=Pelagirhabdus alkalitolerans TaxID=1612202 RepID=A0A1G6L028_9BACI|nr:LrgB family protein [Pelagirhabdus alkalitolerans]SDC35966.1 TIGR00659 family protein [Pelagirhabdus alkalitolerans]